MNTVYLMRCGVVGVCLGVIGCVDAPDNVHGNAEFDAWEGYELDTELLPAPYGDNLLVNPGAETGDMTGWDVTQSGGDGWAVSGWSGIAPTGGANSGDYSFRTSYDKCRREQVVDLMAAGFSESELDAAPSIHVEEYFAEFCEGGDRGLVRVDLQDEYMNTITSWRRQGETDSSWNGPCYDDDEWLKIEHDFEDYGSGLRYITFIDGGMDDEWWAGHYGIRFDDAWVSVEQDAGPTDTIGGTDSFWTASNYFRGNLYQNTNGGELDEYSVYLGLSSNCDLDWYVHSGPTSTGPWQVEFKGTTSASAGTGFFSSPAANVSLTPGTYYGVGVAWNCSATYYGSEGWDGYEAGVGAYVNNYWDNAYGGFSATYTPPNTGGGSLAYNHTYVIAP